MVTASQLMQRTGIAGREQIRRMEAQVSRPSPQQLQEQQERLVESQRQKFEEERKEEITGELSKINAEINIYSERISNIQNQLRNPALSGSRKNQLERDMSEAIRNVGALSKSRKLVSAGFSAESVGRYTRAKIAGQQARAIAKQKAVKFEGQPEVAWRTSEGQIRFHKHLDPKVAEERGLSPVVVGYTGRGVSGFQELPQYRATFQQVDAPTFTDVTPLRTSPIGSSGIIGGMISPAPTGLEKWKQKAQTLLFGAKYRVGEVYGPPAKLAVSQIGLTKTIGPGFVSGVKFFKEYEEKKLREGTLYERKGPEWMKEFDIEAQRRMGTTPRDISQEPFSLKQEYYEMAGTRFDPRTGKVVREIEFYKPGEREKIIEEVLEPLKTAGTYKQQQEAIEALRIRGIKVELTPEGEYEIDVGRIAPTSRLGNLLIGLTDVMFKMALFGPLMRTGIYGSEQQVTEQVRKLTNKEKLEIYKKWIEEIRGKGGYKDKLRGSLRKALISRDKGEIKRVEKIIKDIYAPTKEGEKAALRFIKDVKQQELITSEVVPVKPLIEEVIPIEAPAIPVEEIVPSIYAGTGLYERYAPSELLYPPPIREIEPERLGVTNIFEGVAPAGKIEVEKFGKIPSMGVMGSRLGVIEELRTVEELRAEERIKAIEKARIVEKAIERPKLVERAKVTPVQWLGLSITQISKQRLREKQRYKQITKQIPRPRPPRRVPRVGIFPFVPWWLPEEERKRKLRKKRIIRDPLEGGFMVEVRRRGRFVPEVPFAIPKGEALFLGRRAVKRGAAVTFKLIPVRKKPKKLGVPRITEKALALEFRKPIRKGVTVKDPLTFIQKRKYRIVTSGEKREITMKGWEARRGRKVKWI